MKKGSDFVGNSCRSTTARGSCGLQRLGFSLLLLIATVLGVEAQNTQWQVSSGDWSTATNWSLGVPNSASTAIIGNGGNATISSSDTNETARQLAIGGGNNTGALTINGGSLAIGAGGIFIGNGNLGTLTLNSGTVTSSDALFVGDSAGHSGVLTMSGGTFTESGGNVLIGGAGIVTNGGTGTVTLSGGVFTVSAGGLTLGGPALTTGRTGGFGTLALNGGTLGVSGAITLGGTNSPGGGSGGTGTLDLNSGTVTASSIFVTSNGQLNFGPATGQTVTVNAPISGLSGQNVAFSTAGTVVLNALTDFGSVTISPGATLQFSVNGPAGTAPLTDNGSLVLKTDNYDFGGYVPNNISGSGNVTLVQGQWAITGFNTYTGTTTLNGGTLEVQGNFALSGKSAFIVNAGATLDLDGSNGNIGSLAGNGLVTCNSNAGGAGYLTVGDTNTSTTFSGEISDSQTVSDGSGVAITKVGTGTLILTGSNTISWGVTIRSGTLQLGNGGTTGSLVSTFAPYYYAPLLNNGTLVFDRSDALEFGFAIQGTGNIVQEGGGITTLVGDDSYGDLQNYSGTTTVSAGTLQAGSTSGFSPNSAFTVETGATLDLNGFNNTVGSLAGSGTVTNNGTTAAILTIGNNGTSTAFSGNLVDGTSSLGLTKIGAGTLTLAGSNTYSGPTTVTAGILQAGSSAAFSSASAFVVNGGLDLNGNSSIIGSLAGSGTVTNSGTSAVTLSAGQDGATTTFSGNITDGSGGLGLIKTGAGILTLSGKANSYTGATMVTDGTLSVTGKIVSSAVTVNSGATLFGTGTIGGPVTILSGATLAAGVPSSSTVGTLTVGSLTLSSGSILNYQLGAPNVIGNGTNDLIQVNGNLTLAGTLNISNAGGFGEGVYRLFNYTGSLTNNELAFGTLPTGITNSDLLLVTSQTGLIDLLVSATGFTDQFWDGTNTVGNGTIEGGSGTWDNNTTNWTNADGKTNGPWNKGFAIFSGAAGTVTLGAKINLIGLQFTTDGYVIAASGPQTLIAEPGSIIRVDSGVTATIEAPIVDAKGLPGDITKTDLGTLILTGTNTYSGGTTVSGGTLQLGNGGASGSIVGHVIDNATFAIDRSDAFTFGGNISGTGAFEQIGTGQTTLTGANNYSGTTTVSSGTLQAGSVNAFSVNSQFIVSTGATLDLNGFSSTIGSLTGNGSVINSSKLRLSALTLGGDNTNDIFGGVIGQTGTISLTKVGVGTEILTGANLYTGGTTISGGTLQLGDGSTTGSIIGNVADNAVLAFDRSDSYTFKGVISGSGSVEQEGKGKLILTASNSYTGGTIIENGTLQIGNGDSTGSIKGKVSDKGTLAFDRSDSYSFSDTITGNGSVVQSGTGTLTLSGTNTYSGGTTLESGVLVVDSAQALGRGDVIVSGGVLTVDPGPINVQGSYFQGANGTLQLLVAGANSGQYDSLNVGGNAVLGGTLKLINQNFTPQAGETLTLVKTGGAITSRFANFNDPFTTRAGLNTIDLVYSLHAVDLEFLNIVPSTSPTPPGKITTLNFASFAQTPNELAAAELLDAVELRPQFGNLLSFFLAQPFGDLPRELAIIGPQSFTSFYEISFSDANIQRLTLENRLDDIRAGWGSLNEAPTEGGTVGLQKSSGFTKDGKNPVEPVLQPVRQPRFDLWASGFGDFVHVDSDYNARGYRFTTSGFDLGFDYRFLNHFAVGVMGNYTYTWTDLRPGTITVNSGRGGVYAGYFTDGYYLNSGVYGGYNTYDTSRHGLGGVATGNTDGQEWSGFVSTGYDFHHGDLTVGPIVSLQYSNVYLNSFSETGSLLPLNIHSDSEESLRSDVGFRAYYQWHTGNVVIAPYVKASWEHEFKYSALPITAGLEEFPGPDETFVGPVEGQDSAVISAGISVQWTQAISTYAGYDGQLGRGRYNSNAVTGGVRVSW